MILTIKQLLLFNLHLGHSRKLSNQSMNLYLYGYKTGLSIINQFYTYNFLKVTVKFLQSILRRWGLLLLVNQNLKYTDFFNLNFHLFCKNFKINYIFQGWIVGILTNLRVIKKEFMYYNLYKTQKKDLNYYFTKVKNLKELAKIKIKLKIEQQWREKLKGCFDLSRTPDFVFLLTVIDYIENWSVADCFTLKIPCAALVDSNMNPFGFSYPLLSNNDNLITLFFFIKFLKKNIILSFFDRLEFLYIKNFKLFLKNLKKLKMKNYKIYLDFIKIILVKINKKYNLKIKSKKLYKILKIFLKRKVNYKIIKKYFK